MGPLLAGSSLQWPSCNQGEGSTEDEGEGKERGEAERRGGGAVGGGGGGGMGVGVFCTSEIQHRHAAKVSPRSHRRLRTI